MAKAKQILMLNLQSSRIHSKAQDRPLLILRENPSKNGYHTHDKSNVPAGLTLFLVNPTYLAPR